MKPLTFFLLLIGTYLFPVVVQASVFPYCTDKEVALMVKGAFTKADIIKVCTKTRAAAVTKIKVVSATYGGNCKAKKGNVTAHIARYCNGKSKCLYIVNYKKIGDPAYGCSKTYTVRYKCGSNPKIFKKFLSAEAGWGNKSVELICR